MITQARKDELTAAGYKIEDMEAAWGPGWWSGSFRWINNTLQGDTFGEPQDSEADAWDDASQYQEQLNALA